VVHVFQRTEHLELLLVLNNSVPVVLVLALLLDQGEQDVVELHAAETLECGTLKVSDEAAAEARVVNHARLVQDQLTLAVLRKLDEEFFKLAAVNEALRLTIEISPCVAESINVDWLHGKQSRLGLSEEGIHDNGDEKIQEDLGNDDLETDEVEIGEGSWSALVRGEIVGSVIFIAELGLALEHNALSSGTVEHQHVPGFTRRASHEEQEGVSERLEVSVVVHTFLIGDVHEGELSHTNDCIHEEQKEEQQAQTTHRWG